VAQLKLFMLMLGCKPPGRHVEQHDIFFGIAEEIKDLVPQIRAYWPEPERIHIDAWREVTNVEGFKLSIVANNEAIASSQSKKLFFINLGGYQENKFEEQHYVVLTVKDDRSAAFKEAKQTMFFQHNYFDDAVSHIDDKYGVDVDDLYEIEEMLLADQKAKYRIEISEAANLPEDQIHLGYFQLSKL
jgi:hypothetical protein